MPVTVAVLVLVAAFAHALWNALVKGSRNAALDTALVAFCASLICALLLPWVPQPAAASWPFIALSTALHFGYFSLLAAAYRGGDLSHAYPLMRGIAPLLVALFGTHLLRDATTTYMWPAIVLVSCGVFVIGGLRLDLAHLRTPTTAYALANAAFIAAYTVVDGAGVRRSGSPAGYTLWLLFLAGIPYAGTVLWRRRRMLAEHLRGHWWRGPLGGVLAILSYGIALWAMTQAPIAAVAALRETSVIFAAALGTLLLGEPFGRARFAGAALVAAGVVLLRF